MDEEKNNGEHPGDENSTTYEPKNNVTECILETATCHLALVLFLSVLKALPTDVTLQSATSDLYSAEHVETPPFSLFLLFFSLFIS
jgi:hypothetical protein